MCTAPSSRPWLNINPRLDLGLNFKLAWINACVDAMEGWKGARGAGTYGDLSMDRPMRSMRWSKSMRSCV
jgi:hypothetical protein